MMPQELRVDALEKSVYKTVQIHIINMSKQN